MFDRPTDSWYMYMRPFHVAILLQLRKRQRQDYLRQLAHEEQQRQEQQEQEKEQEKDPLSNSTP